MNVENSDFVPQTGEGRMLAIPEIVRMVRRYVWLIVVLSVGMAILTYFWSRRQPKQYDSVALVKVDQHGQLSLASGVSFSDDYDVKVATEMLEVHSRDLALRVIERQHLEKNRDFNSLTPKYSDLLDPNAREYLTAKFLGALRVERVPKSELIAITFRSESPVLSAQVANSVVDNYLEAHFLNSYQGTQAIKGWLTNELDGLKAKVQAEQSELLNDEVKLGLVNSGQQGETSLYVSQMQALQEEMIKAQIQRFTAEAAYQNIKNADTSVPIESALPGAGVLSAEQTQLVQIQNQEAALTDRFGSGYAPLRALKNQEAELQGDIASRREAIKTAALGELNAAQQLQDDVQKRIDALKDQTQGMNPETVHYQALREQYLADQTLYNNLLTLLSEGSIQAGLNAQEVHRMSVADIPSTPSEPRIFQNTLAAFGIGLLLSIGIISIVFMASDTVESAEQIENMIALPVAASVPIYTLDIRHSSDQITPLAIVNTPRSAAAEAYRTLRTAIDLAPITGRCRIVGITSCGPGEGKSTTALNLAAAASQQGRRVLLIDGDLRRPTLAPRMRVPATAADLTRFLSDPSIRPEQCLHAIDSLPGLSILPTREISPFPSELLGQGRLGELLEWTRKNFDMVLIDTPPLLMVTDTMIIAQALDVLLLVARVGLVQRRALRHVRQELAKLPSKHAALVVNAVPHSQSYYGGYGGYHGYYHDDSNIKH